MTDEVRAYLTSEIETVRSAVFRAGTLGAKTLRPCADAHLDPILRYVTASLDIEEATHLAHKRIAVLARALYAQARIEEIEEARRYALAAIDAFAIVVEEALRGETPTMAGHGPADEAHEPMARLSG